MPPDQIASVPAEAADLYRRGVELLARGDPVAAIPVLRSAVVIDAQFALANVALAVAEDAVGNRDACRTALARAKAHRQISRRERQHVEVVALVMDGKLTRASVLGREHLREFAADVLVIHVLTVHAINVADLGHDQALGIVACHGHAARHGGGEHIVAEDRDSGGACCRNV